MTESSAASGAPADEDAPVEETETAPEPEFVNRAARRAKGKSTGKPEVLSKGQRPVGRGAVQSPRQYGNRRSG